MSDVSIGDSRIEAKAAEALGRSALGAFNLGAARAELKQLLGAVGQTAEFSTYTKHDISHIDALLRSVDWLITERTWGRLTVADALVLTLSIYVHDLGMLVTKEEFKNRHKSIFGDFRESLLADESSRGVDFRERLKELDEDDREHFIYEEFVRVHHAERIEAWVSGKPHLKFGASDAAAQLVAKVFTGLDPVIRSDIALIARSHHAADLDNLSKYKTSRSYGNAPDDEANLQYAALILRTADLVHMTRDRTPTIQYRLASPTDPMGQREWRKQAAVRAVKPSKASVDGMEAIEVHASFDEPEGYFALMEYLDYCDAQLQQTVAWSHADVRFDDAGPGYEFNWNRIDREQIEANHFNRNQFTFSFDQQKVLDLLTGHTLYNDASVAVREIAQNAIDAVRLEHHLHGEPVDGLPDVAVEYDPARRVLRVRDRGTGMTEEILQRHFLKVGSSSYQAKEFKERHPDFASISRFGIGVLSAFMIADEVQVATIASGEAVGRQLVLKSVHGRYLMRDLDPDSDVAGRIGAHGTELELKLRASSEFSGSMGDLLRRWLLLPRCRVLYSEAGGKPVPVGWATPKEALEGLLGTSISSEQELQVVEQVLEGVSIATAEVWNPFFKEWELLRLGETSQVRRLSRSVHVAVDGAEYIEPIGGVSVQGIRVTDAVPGWIDSPVMLIDVSGGNALRTNVARTDLEAGPPLDQLIEASYRAVVSVVDTQVPELSEKASLRFALKEARHLFDQATRSERGRNYSKPKTMARVVSEFQLQPVEVDSILERRSLTQLSESGFSVLIGPAADDAARFMDWLPHPKGMMAILREGGLLADVEENSLPLLGGRDSLFAYDENLWDAFDVESVRGLEGGRSLVLDFTPRASRWLLEEFSQSFVSELNVVSHALDRAASQRRFDFSNRYCVDPTVTFDDLPNSARVIFVGRYRLFARDSPFAELKITLDRSDDPSSIKSSAVLFNIVSRITPTGSRHSRAEDDSFDASMRSWLEAPEQRDLPHRETLMDLALSARTVPVWSTSTAWQRRDDRFGFGEL